MKLQLISMSILLLLISSGCSPKKAENSKPMVTVTVIPQQFFVNQIAGNWLDVNVMVPPGGNEHTYEPTPMQMKALSNSVAYLRIGYLSFEQAWMDKFIGVSPHMKVFDTSLGLDLISEETVCDEHSEGEEHHHHEHEGYNPHIWLSPNLVKGQALNIYHALAELYPEHGDELKVNLDKFIVQVDSVHQVLISQLKNSEGGSFIVYHPVWNYMAREYNLNQIAIEDKGKEATADKLKNIIDFASKNKIHTIFVQKEFSDAQARTIAEQINGRVISLNPLDYNWFSIMNEFGEAFQSSNN